MITNKDVALKILQVGKAGFTTQEDGFKKLDECIELIDKHVSEQLNLCDVGVMLSIEFLEWTEKGFWTKHEYRTEGVKEVAKWYNSINYKSMEKPLTSKELYKLFIDSRKGN